MDKRSKSFSKAAGGSPRLICVGGGKGGVGKTSIAVNLGVSIARRGHRTVVVDADLSGANANILLGMDGSAQLDQFFLQKGHKDLNRLLVRTPYENLMLIAGSTGLIESANPRYQQKMSLMRHIANLSAEVVLIDLAAGVHLNVVDFFLMAPRQGIVVTTPDRIALDNAYKFARAVLFRKFDREFRSDEVSLLLHQTADTRMLLNKIGNAPGLSPETREALQRKFLNLCAQVRPRILVNRARNPIQGFQAGQILSEHVKAKLMVNADSLGYILEDKYVGRAIEQSEPFAAGARRKKAAKCIEIVVGKLGL
ncbi:MinD/ParA family protein [candidate division KSB1 bacterium]